MQCPQCQFENSDTAKFCQECGRKLTSVCRACGHEMPPQAKFCAECGQRLGDAPADARFASPQNYTPKHLAEKILTTRSALAGERKQVTVYFCDIANSTPLAERLGPERMHSLLNQFFELALDEVHRYEGTINQFLGDGFMALFGAPIAHEDHARRTVLAAVRLRQRLQEGATTLEQQYGVTVETRMGLHTGLVIVGAIGDNLRMDYTAVGDTTNVAARLQNAAAPGQIVLSEATHRLVKGYCTTRSLGKLSLKGKAEPMQAWEVLGVSAARTRLEVEVERGLTPFVGRKRELQSLTDCFAQVQTGHGHVVFLVGEAGIGKSRFLFEFHRRLGTSAIWLEGHALSFGRSMAFHPLIDLLKRNFHIEEGDAESTIIEKIVQNVLRLGVDLQPTLSYLRYLLAVDPGDAAVQTMDPKLRRAEIFAALRHLLIRAAEVHPLVLVFEDLHWIDQASEEFLRFMADSIPTSRVLCLFTYRPGYSHAFGERTYHTRLALPTLSTADSVQMARAMLATEHLPEALQTLIVQKAEGNPFFIEEVIKSLQEMGAIRRDGSHYVLSRPLAEIVVPDTVQDILYGITLTGQGNYDKALALFQEGLMLAEKVGDEAIHHRLLNCLGWLYSEVGDLDQALDLNRQSAEIGRRRRDPGTRPNAELNLGEIFLARGDLPLAHECLDGIYRYTLDPTTSEWMKYRFSIRLYADLGEFWLKRGDPDKGTRFAEHSLDLATRSHARKNLVKAWRLKGDIALAQKQWDKAERYLQQALVLAQTVGNPTQLWKTHLALGQLYTEAKRPEQAHQAYRAVREVLDRVRTNLQHPDLRTSFAQSPLIRQIYDLTASA